MTINADNLAIAQRAYDRQLPPDIDSDIDEPLSAVAIDPMTCETFAEYARTINPTAYTKAKAKAAVAIAVANFQANIDAMMWQLIEAKRTQS